MHDPEHFLRVGHRGARGLAPENTLFGFGKAAALGASMVELDVTLSLDRIPVVIHDSTVLRTTDAVTRYPGRSNWSVASFEARELKDLDATSWFVQSIPFYKAASEFERREFLSAGSLAKMPRQGVPSLEEALVFLEANNLSVNIEIKALPYRIPGLVPAVIDVVRRLGQEAKVVFSSFDHALVKDLKEFAPDIAACILTSDRLLDPCRYLSEFVGADGMHPSAGFQNDSLGAYPAIHPEIDSLQETVQALRSQGFLVLPWTVNDPACLKRLKAGGVSGVVTDFPNRLSAG